MARGGTPPSRLPQQYHGGCGVSVGWLMGTPRLRAGVGMLGTRWHLAGGIGVPGSSAGASLAGPNGLGSRRDVQGRPLPCSHPLPPQLLGTRMGTSRPERPHGRCMALEPPPLRVSVLPLRRCYAGTMSAPLAPPWLRPCPEFCNLGRPLRHGHGLPGWGQHWGHRAVPKPSGSRAAPRHGGARVRGRGVRAQGVPRRRAAAPISPAPT